MIIGSHFLKDEKIFPSLHLGYITASNTEQLECVIGIENSQY